jgi:ribosomal protein S18 acetylase RimI-like enzyme
MSGLFRKPPVPLALEIREMDIDDVAIVFHLGERLFTAGKSPNLYRSWDVYDLMLLFTSDGDFCLVAELEDQIVGFALGSFLEKPRSAWRYGYLEWLGVDPSMKGKGIGKRLLNRLTELFIEHGARIMLVDTEMDNVDAIGFFKRQGFGNEVRHVYMSRNLTRHPDYLKKRVSAKQVAAARQGKKPTQLTGPDIDTDRETEA